MNAAVVVRDDASRAVVLRDGNGGMLVYGQPASRAVVVRDSGRSEVVVAGFAGPSGPTGLQGPKGNTGDNFRLSGAVASYSTLPTLTADDAGQAWLTNNDGRVYVWSGSAWPAEGTAPVLQGPAGVDGKPGQIRFVGNGIPGTIIGASPGDQYLDRDTGDIYSLT